MRLTQLEWYGRGNISTLKTEVFGEKSLTHLKFLNVRPAFTKLSLTHLKRHKRRNASIIKKKVCEKLFPTHAE